MLVSVPLLMLYAKLVEGYKVESYEFQRQYPNFFLKRINVRLSTFVIINKKEKFGMRSHTKYQATLRN